jgi:hypothetical protein
MGDCTDYEFFATGDPSAIQSAQAAIVAFKSQVGVGDSDAPAPAIAADGSLSWADWIYGDMNKLEMDLARLTLGNSMQVWVYAGSTDGCCEGAMALSENGRQRLLGRWEADIGLRAAMACFKLASDADEKSAMALIRRIGIADGDGWDDDDWSHLRAGGVCSQMLADAVSAHPEMLQSAELVKALLGTGEAIAGIRKDLRKYKALKKKAIHSIEGLLAVIESLEIGSDLPSEPPGARPPVRL